MNKRRFTDMNIEDTPLASDKLKKEGVVQLTFSNRYLSSVVYIVRCFHQILSILVTC